MSKKVSLRGISNKKYACVILGAGEGTRMKSVIPKVLHEVCFLPMLGHVLNIVASYIDEVIIVAGFGRDLVKTFVNNAASLVEQKVRKGSAHALLQAKSKISKKKKYVLVLYGDTPLLQESTINDLVIQFEKQKADCALVTSLMKDAFGYGRITRNSRGEVTGIVEELNASFEEKKIKEINVGAYCFKKDLLWDSFKSITLDAKKKEYYLTDLVKHLARTGKVISVNASSPEEAMGINSRQDLLKAEQLMQNRILNKHMSQGVTIKCLHSIHIGAAAEIGQDTIIYPNTVIEGPCKIGKNCKIGPFAHIRQDVEIQDGACIGNFVEVTRSKVGKKSIIKHLTYIGDAVIGKDVNIGAGTITANYDGKKKHKTIIEDESQVGSGTIFVAPVKMKKASKTGAGTVVTKGKIIPNHSIAYGVPAIIRRKVKK